MKQEIAATESKPSALKHTPISVAARARESRTKESSSGVSLSSVSKARPKLHSPIDANSRSSIVRRAILTCKPKPAEEKEVEETKIVKVRRHPNEEKANDSQRRFVLSESMVKELQSEVSDLKLQLERLQSRNVLLESQNDELRGCLSSAEATIKAIKKHDQVEPISKEILPSEFKDVREHIANKLDFFPVRREVIRRDNAKKMQPLSLEAGIRSVEIHPKGQPTLPAPPPPPPPPPPRPRSIPSRASGVPKAPGLVEFYHSITKREGKKGHLGSEKGASPVTNNAHNSIVDELQNRSSHLLAIKADVGKKRDFINHLIQKVQYAGFADIEEVLTFVDWLDGQLSTLADERAVLRHFDWPEKKADALREAAFEYRDLKRFLAELSSFEDEVSLSCEGALKKSASLLDKSERSVQRLIKLRGSTMASYNGYKIPTEWMLDSGMIRQIKLASGMLAKVYLKRVSTELESARHSERESLQEALILQGVRFAYRAYQFAGGLDAETMCAFEKLRERSAT